MYSITNEKILFKHLFTIEEAEINQKGQSFKRVRIKKENAVAVLVLNTDTDKIILTPPRSTGMPTRSSSRSAAAIRLNIR